MSVAASVLAGSLPLFAAPVVRHVFEAPGVIPGGGELSVTLGARHERGELHSGLGGYVALAVPLERLAGVKKLPAPSGAAPATETDSLEPDGSESAEPAKPARNQRPREQPVLSGPALSRLAGRTVKAALRAHDVDLRRAELEGLASRSRASAALPELRLRVTHSNDESLRLAPTLEDPDRYTLDGGNDLVLEASATFKLSRLVFADEEIAVERLILERERQVEKLTARVLERVFDWHRALSRLDGASDEDRGRIGLERFEAEVELDVLTGGWFSLEAARFELPRPRRDELSTDPKDRPQPVSAPPTPAPAPAAAPAPPRAPPPAPVPPPKPEP